MNPFRIAAFLITILVLVFLFNKRGEVSILFSENTTVLPESFKYDQSADSLPVFSPGENEENKTDVAPTKLANTLISNEEALVPFFTKLKTTHDTLLRIVYYGDSQIERDFITHPLRKYLQARFGGAGPGYVPAAMYFNNAEGLDIISDDFESHSLSYQKGKDDFGLYGKYFTATGKSVRMKIKNKRPESFHSMKLFYVGKGKLNIQADGNALERINLNDTVGGLFSAVFESTPRTLRLSFECNQPFAINGLTLDPLRGIVLDQVAFRGNLNLMVHKINEAGYLKMAQHMNIGLVVLHFGLNAIPDKRSNYSAYQKALERDITLLKEWIPDASVLVVGASDMAFRSDGRITVCSNIDALVDAQRRAATRKGAAFWDMREAMGGSGAIIEWVEDEKARSDYAHLTKKGGEIIGEKLYNDLMEAYLQHLDSND